MAKLPKVNETDTAEGTEVVAAIATPQGLGAAPTVTKRDVKITKLPNGTIREDF